MAVEGVPLDPSAHSVRRLPPWTHPDDRATSVCRAPSPNPGMGRTAGEASVPWGKTPWRAPSKGGGKCRAGYNLRGLGRASRPQNPDTSRSRLDSAPATLFNANTCVSTRCKNLRRSPTGIGRRPSSGYPRPPRAVEPQPMSKRWPPAPIGCYPGVRTESRWSYPAPWVPQAVPRARAARNNIQIGWTLCNRFTPSPRR